MNSRFGRHVRACRRDRGLTQEALAERADLSADTIRRLELGRFSPSYATLRRLCKGLDLRLSTLFLGFESDRRDLTQEIVDAVDNLSRDERRSLLRLVTALRCLEEGTEDGG